MTTFHTDSARNPDGFHQDSGPHSALKKAASQPASQASSQGNPTSSRSDAQRGGRATETSLTATIRSTPQAIALARLILDLRPEWDPAAVHGWALTDDRPWAIVVKAGINGASDRSIREPAGLRYAGPAAPSQAQTYPTVREALADLDLCDHESRVGACPSCRTGGSS